MTFGDVWFFLHFEYLKMLYILFLQILKRNETFFCQIIAKALKRFSILKILIKHFYFFILLFFRLLL